MLTLEQKKQIVKRLRELLKKAGLVVFCTFSGMPVEKQRQLKKKFKENGGEIFVVKRRLLNRALSEEKIDFPEIKGPVMFGWMEDEVLPAKVVYEFPLEKNEILEFIGGVRKANKGYEPLTKEDLIELAKLPSREELQARLVGQLSFLISSLSFVLKANLQKLTIALSEISKKGQNESEK